MTFPFSAFDRWRTHPRRYNFRFVMGVVWRRHVARRKAESERQRLLIPPIDTSNVEILEDASFCSSVRAAQGHTLLDVARLANIWYLARLAGNGTFLEVGSYRGGTSLHICNAAQSKQPAFYCFDPFEDGGFERIAPEDEFFTKDQFTETSHQAVVKLLSTHVNAKVIKGYFPTVARDLNLEKIAFCHLDVDVYDATIASLEFLAPRLAPHGFIVLDDLNRGVKGVDRAVREFLEKNPSFLLFPLFPSQGLIVSTKLW